MSRLYENMDTHHLEEAAIVAVAAAAAISAPTALLLSLPEYRILICQALTCQHALRPDGIADHLLAAHKIFAKARKPYLEYTTSLDIVGPADVQDPESGGPPIQGLRLHDGQVCRVCGYITTGKKYIEKHANQEHGWVKKQGRQWDIKPVQTFFINNKTRYFIVASAEEQRVTPYSTAGIVNPIKLLLDEADRLDQEERKKQCIIDEDQVLVDLTPWLRKTRWPIYFAGKDLVSIARISHLPSREEESLKIVCKSIDRIFWRCIEGIQDCVNRDWELLLYWLNGHEENKAGSKPFGTYYTKKTVKNYVNYWKRFVCYCLRLTHKDDQHGAQFLDLQLKALHEIYAMVELDEEDKNLLDSRVFDLSIQFIMQSDFTSKRSALVHFTKVLGLDDGKIKYRMPNTYTPMLAGIIFCLRVLLLEHALPTKCRNDMQQSTGTSPWQADPLATLRAYRDTWLVDGHPSPFNYMRQLLVYGMAAAKGAGGRPRIRWSADKKTMYFDGKPLAMVKFRDFITELIDIAEGLLCKELLFCKDLSWVRELNLTKLEDDMNNQTTGFSFLDERGNRLSGGRERVIMNLKQLPVWETLTRIKDGRIHFRPKEVVKYISRVEAFLEYLLILIHFTSGQPARGTELTTIRYQNVLQNLRNIYIEDGQVMVVTEVHKSQAIMDAPRVISRFLPSRVGQLLVTYLADVLPFRRMIDRESMASTPKGFLWADKQGVWDTNRMCKALARETSIHLGHRITVADYRHIAIGIDQMHIRPDRNIEEEEEEHGEEEYEEDNAHDLMACHSSAQADSYAMNAAMLSCLTFRSISKFRDVASRWHRFLRLNSQQRLDDCKRKGEILGHEVVLPDAKRCKLGTTEDDFERTLQEAMDAFIGPSSTFRSSEQREGLLAILQGESPLVVILPTGGGKSLLFMLPATLHDANTTIVIIPFIALMKILLQKCQDAGIGCIEWKENRQQGKASLVLVAAELAGKKTFLDYACNLQLQGQLDHIFIDECHLIITAAEYRELLPQLRELRAIACPLTMLTATLPPSMEDEFNEAMALLGLCSGDESPSMPIYIRAPTHRPNFVYAVETCMGSQMEDRACQLMEEIRQNLQEHERAVLFCRSRPTCERMARRLGCSVYHSTWKDKDSSLNSWMAGDNKIMIATGALGSGADVDGVRAVVHMGRPWTMIDYVQEAGRGGRGGEKVVSTIILSQYELNWLRQLTTASASKWDANKEAMRKYLITTDCRRLVMSGYLDLQARACEELKAELCDNCRSKKHSKVSSD